MQDLRVAYLCDQSPLNRGSYSGGNARIHAALERHVGPVQVLGQGWGQAEVLRKMVDVLPESMSIRARWRLHLAASKCIAKAVQKELSQGQFDVLFCAYSFHSLRHVQAPYPMTTVFTSDATQTVYRNSEIGQSFGRKFPGGQLLDRWIERCEQEVFQAADLCLWPSDWLKEAADTRYGLNVGSEMVPWGANITTPPVPKPKVIGHGATVQLLLIGRDWFAKGGPVAFDTMQTLRGLGIDAQLTVIGCVPPEFHVNEFVTVHPFLDKSDPAQAAQFDNALERAHFLIQPSFESYGFAFCEASAFGLPSLCLRVGGVPVVDGVNGHALPLGADSVDFAKIVQNYLNTPESYAALSRSSRAYFDSDLNWDAWGQRVASLLKQKISAPKA